MRLDGKNIILTGGGRGIGRSVACRLAELGGTIALISRSGQELSETLDLVSKYSSGSFYTVCDVSSGDSISEAFKVIKTRMNAIHVLVNNAGIQGPIGRFHENDLAAWETNIRTNLLGPVILIHHVLPLMMGQKTGKIINMSGGGATGTRPNFSAYAVSKTALVRFTENLADEYREFNIDVNSVSPGAVNTRMLDEVITAADKAGNEFRDALRRQSAGGTDPAVAAELIAFLASDASDGISGKLISAPWDPWKTDEFRECLKSDKNLATLRRIDNKYFKEKS